MNQMNNYCGRTRREFLHQVGGGFMSLALTQMLDQDGLLSGQVMGSDKQIVANPLAAKKSHFPVKAKNVIFLYMYGGPSHVDTFDYKPVLFKFDGKTIPVKTKGRGGEKNEGRVVGPKWKFKKHGESGQWASTLFPELSTVIDDIAFIKSMTADSPIHGSAMMQMNSGRILGGSPTLGSWLNYGLGSENENLPGYIVMLDPSGGPINGAQNWSSGFMPATYQGTILKSKGAPILDLASPEQMTRSIERKLLDALSAENKEHQKTRLSNSELAARISSYELAFNMQKHAPEAVDLKQETKEIHQMYGLNHSRTEDFGKRCLLARRLVERGVRFVQLYSGGNHNDYNWDAHGDLVKNHNFHAGNTDKPITALIKDLKQRGLFEETVIIWGGEFGRQPTAEYAKGTGRDHNSYGFTMWMAGGGIKGGVSIGETDELGSAAVKKPFQVKHLHATILYLMGLDPNKLSYFHGSLDQKLVGVEPVEPIHEIIA